MPSTEQRRKRNRAHNESNKPRLVQVFISYSNEDNPIAEALYNLITDLDANNIGCFLDYKKIQTGKNWEEEIEKELQVTDWLIAIYTGIERNQFDYCGFECGVWRQVQKSRKLAANTRAMCLHDMPAGSVPLIFRNFQNRALVPLINNMNTEQVLATPFGQFFSDFIDYWEDRTRSRLSASDRVRRISEMTFALTAAFTKGPNSGIKEKYYFQRRIKLRITDQDSFSKSMTIPDSSLITTKVNVFELLGIPRPRLGDMAEGRPRDALEEPEAVLKWNEFKDAVRHSKQDIHPIVDFFEQIVRLPIGSLASTQVDDVTVTGATGQVYRLILSRYLRFRNDNIQYSIQIVPLISRNLYGSPYTSFLLYSILFASRFRFQFIDGRDDIIRNRLRDRIPDHEFVSEMRKIRSDIARLEQEAREFGLENIASYHKLFDRKGNTTLRQMFDAWPKKRTKLFDVIDGVLAAASALAPIGPGERERCIQALDDLIGSLSELNKRFLAMAIDRYRLAILKGEVELARSLEASNQ